MATRDDYFWVPEHPMMPLYRAREPKRVGKLGTQEELTTASIHDAMQFATKEGCEAWIAMNPHPVFVAREHGIMGVLVIECPICGSTGPEPCGHAETVANWGREWER